MTFFNPRYKLLVHIFYIAMVAMAMGLSVPRLLIKSQPRTRANTIALGMGAKSLVFIAYQLLTEHVTRFSRWRSYKTYSILNSLEVVFWAAVAFLVIQANFQHCSGTVCTLCWVVAGLAIALSIVAVYTAVLSWLEYRHYHKRCNVSYGCQTSFLSDERGTVEMGKRSSHVRWLR